jgi:uncharacterized protein YdcH (DUF465 family)
MEVATQEDLKAQLMATDEEFAQLAMQHSVFKQKVAELEAKDHLTLEEEYQEHELKKQKLRLKDQMNAILSRHLEEQPVH